VLDYRNVHTQSTTELAIRDSTPLGVSPMNLVHVSLAFFYKTLLQKLNSVNCSVVPAIPETQSFYPIPILAPSSSPCQLLWLGLAHLTNYYDKVLPCQLLWQGLAHPTNYYGKVLPCQLLWKGLTPYQLLW
jgi:hypothetical protein